MDLIHTFPEQPGPSLRPLALRNPFDNDPHPLAIIACEALQCRLKQSPDLTHRLWQPSGGKMFGVLVVRDPAGRLGYLAGFSGMLNKQWNVAGFVPPLFDVEERNSFLRQGELELKKLTRLIKRLSDNPARVEALSALSALKQQKDRQLGSLKERNRVNKKHRHLTRQQLKKIQAASTKLADLSFQSQRDKREYRHCKMDWDEKEVKAYAQYQAEFENEINQLHSTRKRLSRQLHIQVFNSYQVTNGLGETVNVRSLFDGKIPPGGTGDCAAPKLIQYANLHKLKPLALAEFWWGASPAKEVRHHGYFYPPCRGKCHPLLPFMLQGISVEESSLACQQSLQTPCIVYEDPHLLVLNKPAGLLSVPGKDQDFSVQSWLQQRYADAGGTMLVHRLDMATSGLLIAAKSARVHKKLQSQFIRRSISKRYVAILSKKLEQKEITINLPLRVDLDDRPRQLVCHEYGKQAITRVKVVSADKHTTRVHFYPLTGRTHQLRVHAAHPLGLSAPIVGDVLYGTQSTRMLLHAEFLGFQHPVSGRRLVFTEPAPF